jgi:hypothetical protein
VNVKRVERIWRQEGLKVPDFVKDRTHNGRFRMLNIHRRVHPIRVATSRTLDVIDALSDLLQGS